MKTYILLLPLRKTRSVLMMSFLRLFWGEQDSFKHFKVSCHHLLDWTIIIKKSTINSIIVLLKIMNLFPLLTAFKISHLCFLLLLLNDRFFKFYNASQFSKVSHTWFCIAFVQSQSHVQLFVTPWTAAFQASLSFTISWSLPIFTPLRLVMLPNHLILCRPFSFYLQSFPASRSFPVNWLFASGGPSIRGSASASVLPMNIQGWFPLGLTDLISVRSKGLSRVFSNTTVQKHWFFSAQLTLWSNSHICTWLLEKP